MASSTPNSAEPAEAPPFRRLPRLRFVPGSAHSGAGAPLRADRPGPPLLQRIRSTDRSPRYHHPRAQAGHGHVGVGHTRPPATANRVPVPGARGLAQDGLEPPPVEADGNDYRVIRDTLALIAVRDSHNHVVLARLDLGGPPGESAE